MLTRLFPSIDFEDTYDGLGDQLDETDDAFNDDTFGAEPGGRQAVGKDFDFSGQTAKIAGTLEEEQMLYAVRQPPPKPSPTSVAKKPARTGYENYAQPGYIPQLEANASIWGISKKPSVSEQAQPHQPSREPIAPAAKKIMSLSEVEAAMLAQTQKQQRPSQQSAQPVVEHSSVPQASNTAAGMHFDGGRPPQILQRPQPPAVAPQQMQMELPGQGVLPQQAFPPQRAAPPRQVHTSRAAPPQYMMNEPSGQPRQILQNPNRLSGQNQILNQPPQHQRNLSYPHGPNLAHGRHPSFPGPFVTNQQQLMHLSEEDRTAFMIEDARRAKRNHKIFLLSKDNGLMTPQDKNFVTRIQLQQLVTATGDVDEHGPEAALAEDFYYQVYSQIRGAQRQTPHQPANQFAQTYLFQTGGRYGLAGRRGYRGGDNHVQRMEQQVQRAVEAAKLKPKNKHLGIEGSLGIISFSNAKTPKPLLNIKRQSSDVKSAAPKSQTQKPTAGDRKAVLRDIENLYTTLMQLEDQERRLPPPINENSDPARIQEHMEWRQKTQSLNQQLWRDIKVMEPINPQ